MRWIATVTLLLILNAGLAVAESYQTSALVPQGTTNWIQDIQLEPFDTSLGALTAVQFFVEGRFDGEFFHENTGDVPTRWRDVMTWNLDVFMERTNRPYDVIRFDDQASASGELLAYDGTDDYAGSSGTRRLFHTPIGGGILITGSGVNDFISDQPLDVHLEAYGQADLSMSGSGLFGSKSTCTAKVILTYEYTTDSVANETASWSQVKALYR